MSSGGAGWPPSGADGGPYADDELGADGRYADRAGYDWSEPSGRSRDDRYGQGFERSSGRHSGLSSHPSDGTDAGQFRDRGGYGGAGYGEPAYGQDAYGGDWSAGRGYSGDQPSRDSYDRDPGRGWYGQEPASGSFGEPGYGAAGYERDGYGRGDYASGSYGYEQYDRDGQAGYGGDYYGQAPGRGDGYGGYRRDGMSSDSYGRDMYTQEGYGSSDGYRPADGFGSPDGGSFDNRDSGWFDRPDTGSFGVPDDYGRDGQQSRYGLPAGTVRRAELGGPTPGRPDDEDSPLGASSARGGYDPWQHASDDADSWHGDEPAGHEDDWADERGDSSLLSRRFSGGGSDRGPSRRAGRARRQRRVRGKFAVTAAILAGALVLGAVADFGYEKFQAWHTTRYGDYTGLGSGQVRFTVPAGAALSSLGPALKIAGVIMEVRPFDTAANVAHNPSSLQPGIYLLHKRMSSANAVTWLLSGKHRINDTILIREGLRAVQIAQLLATQTGLPVSQFKDIINNPPASLGLPSWAGRKNAEGFLFPDTYTLAPGMSALQILRMMVMEFNHQVAAAHLVSEARNVFTSPWHALIVASLIQAEAGRNSDFPKISRVVWNRLRLNMKLQFDSTIFYAMGTYGTYAKTPAQQNYPSPYNTYLHAGLPPGPIGNPGILAMQAAVHAAKNNCLLYFIADTKVKPPLTQFTCSYSTFLAWKNQYEG